MSERKKIVYLRTDIDKQELIAGGSASHTHGVMQGFLAEGYDIIYASSLTIPVVEQLGLFQIIKLKNPAFLSFLRWKINCILSNIFFTKQLLCIKKDQIDFIYQRYSLLNCTGVLISRLKGIPLTLEYNGSEVWVARNWAYKKQWFNFIGLIKIFEWINIRYAHSISVVSQVLKDELIARGIAADKILVNPNGVNPFTYDPAHLASERDTLRVILGIDDKFVFGFIGTFSQWHGIEILAHMIPAVCKQQPRAHFVLIGDGPLKNYLVRTIEAAGLNEQVTCTGLLPSEQASKYLAACDAFLCPTQSNPDGSRFFGSPTKLFEYMSLGKPIIASDLEQLAEIIHPAIRDISVVTDQALGILLPSTDVQKFIQAAVWLSSQSYDARHAMGIRNREKVMHHYTWQLHSKRIIDYTRRWYASRI